MRSKFGICSGTGVVDMLVGSGVVFAIDDPRRRPTARSKRADALDWSARSPHGDIYDERAAKSEGTAHSLRRRRGGHVGRPGKVFTIDDPRRRFDAIPGELPDGPWAHPGTEHVPGGMSS